MNAHTENAARLLVQDELAGLGQPEAVEFAAVLNRDFPIPLEKGLRGDDSRLGQRAVERKRS